jgi:hypothetical protein
MPIAINGSGTITGISAGGLPDASVTADEIASGAVTPAKLSTGAPSWDSGGVFSFNSGYGSVATAYGCRAWVNFNGTGTVAIRASGNVSSITDNGVGDYTVNFATAMPNANYCGVSGPAPIGSSSYSYQYISQTTSAARFTIQYFDGNRYDLEVLAYAVFR